MFRKRTARAALALLVSVALAGCGTSDPQPTNSPTTTPSESVVTEVSAEAAARAAFDGFFSAVDAQFADRSPSAAGLEAYAEPALAAEYAEAIQTSLDRGQVTRGVPTVLTFATTDFSADGVIADLCTDSSGLRTIDDQGLERPGAAVLRWTADFSLSDGTALIRSLEPHQDAAECTG
ncbi:hypothetical protein [Agrococcus sp. Marseille-Q4369]|uniref:hypothetical protein n=1 Tax=Agrococcus sp. Marseille-Q4369 TaxID=2810513 RepID=UPI001B8B30BA|nr:hypothetical protein [Agrococcus sp. Marseille-Q4369]QUW17884.1 hypothetical protein JSQ78_08400 [Agrococcus sp. Marseille-Q4369]